MPATLTAPRAYLPPIEGTYTAEDMLNHPEWGRCELVRGKVVSVCLPNRKHGRLSAKLISKLDSFVEERALGLVFTESGVVVENDPDTVRGPDIYFVRAEHCPVGDTLEGYTELPPDLCVEIVSPRDQPLKLREKIAEYLKFGVKLIWIIDPMTHQARIYRLDGSTDIIPASGVLSGEDVLPGFELPLAELFAALVFPSA